MSDKFKDQSTITTVEADELKVIVSELNEHVAHLSKMVLQLQKSMKDEQKSRHQSAAPFDKEKKTKTLH